MQQAPWLLPVQTHGSMWIWDGGQEGPALQAPTRWLAALHPSVLPSPHHANPPASAHHLLMQVGQLAHRRTEVDGVLPCTETTADNSDMPVCYVYHPGRPAAGGYLSSTT